VLSRDQLLDLTRGREATPFDRSIDVQVGRLRRRLDDDDATLIQTVRGEGYVFAAEVEAEP
jgi:two-component system OmpR family response regulator